MGPFRAAGRVKLTAITMFIAFWVVGVPMAYFLGFTKRTGLRGMYFSFTLAYMAAATVEILLAFFWIDYKHEAIKAQGRNDRAARELAFRDAGEVAEYRDDPERT